MSSTVDGLAGELVGGLEAQASMGTVAALVPQPVAHGDVDVVVVVEPPPVEELAAEAEVVALVDLVLPEAARGDVDGLDAVVRHELLDGFGDELGAIVGPDFLGLGVGQRPQRPDLGREIRPRCLVCPKPKPLAGSPHRRQNLLRGFWTA